MNPTVKKPGKTERGDFAAPSCDTPYGRLYARLKAACVRGIVGTIAIRNIGSKETSDDKDHMTNPKVENAQYILGGGRVQMQMLVDGGQAFADEEEANIG